MTADFSFKNEVSQNSLAREPTLKLKNKHHKMQYFRIVIPTLLYVIGMPRKYCNEGMLSSQAYFGQFGAISRIMVKSDTKDFYEQQGQCAVYVWYESPTSVALALSCLNGLRIPTSGNSKYCLLKCSVGTSKYCANFLKDSRCESHESAESCCPFIHEIEHRRDKVIQDDFEFKDFLSQQDSIASMFTNCLGLTVVAEKNRFFQQKIREPLQRQGLPSPMFIFGKDSKHFRRFEQFRRIREIKYLRIAGEKPQIVPLEDEGQEFDFDFEETSPHWVNLPTIEACSVKICHYKKCFVTMSQTQKPEPTGTKLSFHLLQLVNLWH